jgi:hypothetical protein
MTETPTLIIDYGRRRVTLTHSTPARAAGRDLWDQSQWCGTTFKPETHGYYEGRWFFKRPKDLTMFILKWSSL